MTGTDFAFIAQFLKERSGLIITPDKTYLLEMRQAGASTLVQDEATSVVWGMPGAAVKMGAAQHVLPLHRVASEVLQLTADHPNSKAAHG